MLNRPAVVDILDRPKGVMRPGLSPGSIETFFTNGLRPFVRELDRLGVTRLCDVDDGVLRAYAETVATLPISRSRKRLRLLTVTRIWLHAPHLPAADQIRMPPWEAARADDFTSALFGPPAPMGENMTPPIHPATMSPLLLWALRYVERFAQDIIRAKEIRDAMVAQVRDHSRPGEQEVWEQFLDGLRGNDGSVPGWLLTGNRPAIAAQYLAAKLDVGRNTIWDHRPDDIPICIGAPLDLEIEGRVEGDPWVDSVDFYEVDGWIRRLSAACFVVIAYLTLDTIVMLGGQVTASMLAEAEGIRPSAATNRLVNLDREGYLVRKPRGRREGARALAKPVLALPEAEAAEDRAFALSAAAGPRRVLEDAVRQPREGH